MTRIKELRRWPCNDMGAENFFFAAGAWQD
jgi:hypothetical protein